MSARREQVNNTCLRDVRRADIQRERVWSKPWEGGCTWFDNKKMITRKQNKSLETNNSLGLSWMEVRASTRLPILISSTIYQIFIIIETIWKQAEREGKLEEKETDSHVEVSIGYSTRSPYTILRCGKKGECRLDRLEFQPTSVLVVTVQSL